MRLEIGSIAIRDLEFGTRTDVRDHALVLDRDEIRQIVLEDSHFDDVEIHLAKPGESVRIVHVLDVVEPRWKVAGPGGVFPGFVSPPSAVGEGRTHRLAGVAVVATGDPVPGEPTHWRERLIDMAGPGAQYSPFGQTLNLVLHFKPNPSFFPPGCEKTKDILVGSAEAVEYNRAITLAGMKIAARLGRASQELQPDEVETFELASCDPTLPKVVCIYQFVRFITLYGLQLGLPLGTVVHPNEFFDGAVSGWRADITTGSIYWEQNNVVMQQLCRRHGKDLQFVGCIPLVGATPYREDKERLSSAVTKLARLLYADAALFLGVNGSNYAIDLMWAIEKCEQAGIKTTLIYHDVGYGAGDPGFIFSVAEANAIVSAGSRDQPITLPRMQKVIGGVRLVHQDLPADGELHIPIWYLHSALGVQGYGTLATRFE